MPLRSDWSDHRCPVERSLNVVGDPWVLLVLRQALSGVSRFEGFRADTGAADNVLARRLHDMVEAGLLRREPYRDGNRTRQEYLLTAAGADLLPLLNQLALWGEKHRPHSDPAVHMEVVHLDCGGISTTADLCSACGGPMDPGHVSWRKSWAADEVILGRATTAAG